MSSFRTSNIDFSRPPDTQLARDQAAAKAVLDDELMARLGSKESHSPAAPAAKGGVSAPAPIAPPARTQEVTRERKPSGTGTKTNEVPRVMPVDAQDGNAPTSLASRGSIRPFTFNAERRPIRGFGEYSITAEGDVYTADGRRLSSSEKSGKRRVQMRADDGSYTSRTIDRLLAEAWGT